MSEETNRHRLGDPMEVWEQWYDAASKGLSRATNGNGSKPVSPDPFSFYRIWLNGVTSVQQQLRNSAGDPQELWKRWFETTADAWRKATEMGGLGSDPFGLMKQSMEMMEEARASLLAGVTLPVDPFLFFKQWYDATNDALSTAIGDVIGTEQFMEFSSEFLKSYTGLYATMRRSNEEYLRNLQIPTRTDIARVAGLVVNLEDKVDRVDSQLEDFADGVTSDLKQFPLVLQKLEAIERLDKRVGGLEKGLEKQVGSLEKRLEEQVGVLEKGLELQVGGLEGRLDQQVGGLEERLNERVGGLEERLNERVGGLEKGLEQRVGGLEERLYERIGGLEKGLDQRVGGLEKRLDGVEGKLDALLAALEKLSAREAEPVKSPPTARRASRKSSTQTPKFVEDEAQAES